MGLAWLIGGEIAQAQQSAKLWKIGLLVSSSKTLNAARDASLRQGLRDRGYEENKNIILEYRYAEGKTEHLPQLARELAGQRPDVIVVSGTAVAVAAKTPPARSPSLLPAPAIWSRPDW